MRMLSLPDGGAPLALPVLGLGTWRFGESSRRKATEVASVRTALALGYRLIDTAEMYGDGGAEEVVGVALAEAIRAGEIRREDVTIVSKILRRGVRRSRTAAL